MYTLRNKQKGLSILLIIMILAGVLFSTAPVFADDAIQALTLEAKDFTIIRPILGGDKIKLYGLTHDWQRVELSPNQADKVTATSSDTSIAYVYKVSPTKDQYRINTLSEGIAKILFTSSDSTVDPVHSYVVGEHWYTKAPVKNITVNVKFNGKDNQADILNRKVTVSPGQLMTEVDGNQVNVDDTLLKSASALHALVEASKVEPTFTVGIDPSSAFVASINGVEGEFYDNAWHGWQYSVNGETPDWGSGIHQIYDDDTVTFEYKAYSPQ